MRIVFDLQSCQTPNSRYRGIGRYSLAHVRGCISQAGARQVVLLLNDRYPQSIADLRAEFADVLDPRDIRVFSSLGGLSDIGPGNSWHHRVAQELYQEQVRALQPDVFHVTSLFETFSDAVTGIQPVDGGIASATLYDLIPLQYADTYLVGEALQDSYHRKLQALHDADLLLSISESSRREALGLLGLPPERIVNISSAIDEHFQVRSLAIGRRETLRQRYGLNREYIIYTGGIDFRKNIEGLIEAYAQLPTILRERYQLVVVCRIDDANRIRLQRLARGFGIAPDNLVLTDFVPEEDLVDLYNLASLFVFPSLHEGFGLPALEAMACGVPTIAANCSSLPEVVGLPEALFDPRQPAAIARAMEAVLANPAFAARLREHGLQQAKRFSWANTARATLDAFDAAHQRRSDSVRTQVAVPAEGWPRPRLAFVSPLPPAQSGIADYSGVLLRDLARYYEIDVITPQATPTDPWLRGNFPCRSPEWFDRHAHCYDRVLYQFGNSDFHSHMFGLLERHPGTVVLHDFFLSGILAHLERSGVEADAFACALYRSHGYAALECMHREGIDAALARYPANLPVLAQALGVIVHSEYSRELARQHYAGLHGDDWVCLPLLRARCQRPPRDEARRRLGVPAQAHVTASFGFVAPTKQVHELLDAWLMSCARNPDAWLVLVGRNHLDSYGEQLWRKIERSPARERIRITGYASSEDYDLWLAAADMAVQLRRGSRGETSAAVYDCLAAGLPLICNASGSMAELPEGVVVKLPGEFCIEELATAMQRLSDDPALGRSLTVASKEYSRAFAPERVARCYWEAIEGFYQKHPRVRQMRLVERLREVPCSYQADDASWLELACACARNIPQGLLPVCYIDLGDVADRLSDAARTALLELLRDPPTGWRVELVVGSGQEYRVAHDLACRWLDLPEREALPLLTQAEDAWLHLEQVRAPAEHHAWLLRRGVLSHIALGHMTSAALTAWLGGMVVDGIDDMEVGRVASLA